MGWAPSNAPHSRGPVDPTQSSYDSSDDDDFLNGLMFHHIQMFQDFSHDSFISILSQSLSFWSSVMASFGLGLELGEDFVIIGAGSLGTFTEAICISYVLFCG